MFAWLRRRRDASHKQAATEPNPQDRNPTPMREVFRSPAALADWIDEHILRSRPWQKDFALLPDEEAQRDLNITFDQRQRLTKEWTVLRVAGMCWAMREASGDTFYQALLDELAKRTAAALDLTQPSARTVLGQAIDDYVSAAQSEDDKRIQILYMRRIYDDSDHYVQMLAAGIGTLAIGPLVNARDALFDEHTRATTGFSAASAQTILEALKHVQGKQLPPNPK